jgi:hypothetical protein
MPCSSFSPLLSSLLLPLGWKSSPFPGNTCGSMVHPALSRSSQKEGKEASPFFPVGGMQSLLHLPLLCPCRTHLNKTVASPPFPQKGFTFH